MPRVEQCGPCRFLSPPLAALVHQLRRLPALAKPPVPFPDAHPPRRMHLRKLVVVVIDARRARQRPAHHACQVMSLEPVLANPHDLPPWSAAPADGCLSIPRKLARVRILPGVSPTSRPVGACGNAGTQPWRELRPRSPDLAGSQECPRLASRTAPCPPGRRPYPLLLTVAVAWVKPGCGCWPGWKSGWPSPPPIHRMNRTGIWFPRFTW
jgi:hypothetical protein